MGKEDGANLAVQILNTRCEVVTSFVNSVGIYLTLTFLWILKLCVIKHNDVFISWDESHNLVHYRTCE